MQFRVPQFLDIEDKIFGPFTFSQFVYLTGGGGLAFVVYKLLGLFVGLIPILAILGFALALTFYRPNNKPFVNMLENSLKYFAQSKLYLWKRKKKKMETEQQKEEKKMLEQQSMPRIARLGESKLRDLSWSLDILDLKKEVEKEENKDEN